MIIAVCNSKGGVGKSLLASNLALAYHESGASVLVVDTDPQGTTEEFFNERAQSKGKIDVTCVSKPVAKGLRDQIKHLAASYDRTVVDAGGRDNLQMREALLVADVVLIPVVPCQKCLSALDKTAEIIEDCKGINDKIRPIIIINNASTNYRDQLTSAVLPAIQDQFSDDYMICKTVLKTRSAWVYSGFESAAIWEVEGRENKAAQEFSALLAELDAAGML